MTGRSKLLSACFNCPSIMAFMPASVSSSSGGGGRNNSRANAPSNPPPSSSPRSSSASAAASAAAMAAGAGLAAAGEVLASMPYRMLCCLLSFFGCRALGFWYSAQYLSHSKSLRRETNTGNRGNPLFISSVYRYVTISPILGGSSRSLSERPVPQLNERPSGVMRTSAPRRPKCRPFPGWCPVTLASSSENDFTLSRTLDRPLT
mmetsp:Transcript_7073/g.13494  ORF Transcript_7073/g.13494 Transcript_7073/m.13494 type:complete len:205 (+) Transcript_7073:487-1101(+)